jgi:hypothetical protein
MQWRERNAGNVGSTIHATGLVMAHAQLFACFCWASLCEVEDDPVALSVGDSRFPTGT